MKQRNGLIDFYRFIFSLIIVIHHAMWLDGRCIGEIENKVYFRGDIQPSNFSLSYQDFC